MTTTHPTAARIVHHESALSILLAHRNVHCAELRSDTRFCILRTIGALRLLRAVGV